MPTYSTVYGALAALPILLPWIYLGWLILLLGAVIAAYAPSLQMRLVSHPATPGGRFELALAELMRSDPLQLEPLVEMLGELDWVSRLDEANSARLVLLCDPAATPLLPLVQRTLMAPGVASTAFGLRAVATAQGVTLVLSYHAFDQTPPSTPWWRNSCWPRNRVPTWPRWP